MRCVLLSLLILLLLLLLMLLLFNVTLTFLEWNTYYIRQQTSLVLWQKPEKLVVNTHRLNQSFFP